MSLLDAPGHGEHRDLGSCVARAQITARGGLQRGVLGHAQADQAGLVHAVLGIGQRQAQVGAADVGEQHVGRAHADALACVPPDIDEGRNGAAACGPHEPAG